MRKEVNSLTKKVLKSYSELIQAQDFINNLYSILQKSIADPEFDVVSEITLKTLAMPRFDILKNEAMQLRARIKKFCAGDVKPEEASAYLSKLSCDLEDTLDLFDTEKIANFLKS